jgi:hypothetical protein
MAKYNYKKLMSHNPTEYGRMTNKLGQNIVFLEHPIKGDESFVICACPELELAADSDFFELDDMLQEHGEYAPAFVNGEFQHGV